MTDRCSRCQQDLGKGSKEAWDGPICKPCHEDEEERGYGYDMADLCRRIYDRAARTGGRTAVETYIRENWPEVPWLHCEPCEDREPMFDDNDHYLCLVCGTLNKAPVPDTAQ